MVGTPLFPNDDTSAYETIMHEAIMYDVTAASVTVSQPPIYPNYWAADIPGPPIDPNFPHPLVTNYQPESRRAPPINPLVTNYQPESRRAPPYQISNSYSFTVKHRKECSICMGRKTKRRMRCCDQVVCQTCVLGWHSTNHRTCPFCRKSYG